MMMFALSIALYALRLFDDDMFALNMLVGIEY